MQVRLSARAKALEKVRMAEILSMGGGAKAEY
jgi:hypothetical protein